MNKIPQIDFVCPIITLENYKEALRQNEIIGYKKENPKINLSSKSIKTKIDKSVQKRIHSNSILGYSFGSSFSYIKNRIFINLKWIKITFGDNRNDARLTFEEKICETISHEIIHICIDALEGEESDASYCYDNIKEKLRSEGYRGC